jgi:NTE family protein
MPTAFVFSGGASLGAAQAGMLHALYERGIRPDMLIGTSAGAINAAFVASRPPTVGTARELQHVWQGLSRGQIFPTNPLTAGLGLIGRRDHAVPSGPLRRLIERHLDFDRLEQAAVPLHVVATDVLTGEDVRLSEGPAAEAILASSAIPGVFAPVRWDSRTLVDGAVANNAPISHAIELGADEVYVLSAFTQRPLTSAPRGALAAGVTAITRMIGRRVEEDLRRYADVARLTVLPGPSADILPIDFGHAEELIAEGLVSARRTLMTERGLTALARAA